MMTSEHLFVSSTFACQFAALVFIVGAVSHRADWCWSMHPLLQIFSNLLLVSAYSPNTTPPFHPIMTGSYEELSTPEHYRSLLSKYDVFLFDCDGVIWSGDDLLPNVKSVLDKLRSWGKEIIFVTNNASKSRKALLGKFDKMGIPAQEVSIIIREHTSDLQLGILNMYSLLSGCNSLK